MLWTSLLFTYFLTNSWTSKTGPLPLDSLEVTYLEPIAPELLQIYRLYPTPGKGRYMIYNVDIGIRHTMYGYRDANTKRDTPWNPAVSDIPTSVTLSRFEFGWPFRMLNYDTISTGLSTDDPLVMAYHQRAYALAGANRGLDRPVWLPNFIPLKRIPIAVNWVALFLNVLVCSVICYALLSCRPLVRAWIRHRRHKLGLCVNCKYTLEELSQCPECGTLRN